LLGDRECNEILTINAVFDLCEYTETVKKLASIAGSWKSFKVELNNKEINSNILYELNLKIILILYNPFNLFH